MAGVVMRLLGKKALDFSALGVNTEQMLLVNGAITVASYREATLVVRVHSQPTIEGNAAIKVALVRAAPTEEEPGMVFTQRESGTTMALVTLDNATQTGWSSTGTVQVATLPSNFGGYLALVIVGKQDSSVRTIKADISVDLSLKE